MNKKIIIFLSIIFGLILPLLPINGIDYITRVATLTVLYIVLALGLNIIVGFAGLLDLGYVGFYGIGAYVCGLLSVHYGLSFWILIPIAMCAGALSGIILGAPTLRLSGDYFAIVTFGFAELVILIVRNEIWLTRGPMGIAGIPPVTIFSHPLTKVYEYYYLIFAIFLIILFIIKTLENSKIGRAWFAIREDEIAARCCGINIVKYKILAFATSASIGAIGGAFFARWFTFIHPDMFKFWESILILCLIVFGGMGNVWGVILGTIFLIPITEILRNVLPQDLVQARYLIFGLLLVIMMRFRPNGIIPFTKR
jgi:branched-chain amino acid transport system permease protein